ncbi:MAG: DUF6443 domain-containing protein, partial [Cyclobacteriaceae bacterium]
MKNSALLSVFVLISSFSAAQMTGPTNATVGQSSNFAYYGSAVYGYYTWSVSPANGYVSTYSRSGTIYYATVVWTNSGSSTVTLMGNGSFVGSINVSITCPAATTPNATFSYSSNTCGDKIISYTGSAQVGTTWYWQTSSTGTATSNSTNQFAATSSGIYYLRGNISCNGTWTSAQPTTSVTVNPIPGLATASVSPTSICGSGSVSWSATGAGTNQVYRWYNVSSGGSPISPPSSVSATTTLYVSIFNTITTCEGNRIAVTITVNAIPGTATGSVIPTLICGVTGSVAWSASGAGTNEVYRWYTTSSGGTPITPATSVSTTTTNYVSRFNTVTGCEGSRTALTVTVDAPITTAPSVTGNSRFGTGTLTLVANGTPGGGSYKWYNSSNIYLPPQASSYTTGSVSASALNYMFVRAVSSSGCEGPQAAIDIYVYPLPVVTAPQNYVIKEVPVVLTATAGNDTYTWRNAANAIVGTSQTFVTSVANTYTVTVTKSGLSATSTPFVLSSQFAGMNKNYIVSNTVQIGGLTDANAIQNLSAEKVAQQVAYFDGLGRPTQTISTQGSVSKTDLVAPVVYDDFGREAKKYLPVVTGSDGRYKESLMDAGGNYLVDTYSNTSDKIADDTRPFTETIFE